MPTQKDLKTLVRTRMKKTGESYTTARTQLLKKKSSSKSVTDTELAALAGMSTEAVSNATGKNWRQWTRLLDVVDGPNISHRDRPVYVYEEFDISEWWAQMLSVGYERIRGLREIGQRMAGTYDVSKSKTYPVPLANSTRRLQPHAHATAGYQT